MDRILQSRFVSLFYAGGSSSNVLSTHLSKYTLNFKVPELEKQYTKFVDKSQKVPSIVVCIVCIIILLCYIALDASYDEFFALMLVRLGSSGSMAFGLALILVISARGHIAFARFGAVLIVIVYANTLYSLILRHDTSFSPIIFILFWGTHVASAPFLVQRVVLGVGLIVVHTCVWLFVLDMYKDLVSFLVQQTLNYSLFYVGIVIAAYARELMHRTVYMQTQAILSSSNLLRSSSTHSKDDGKYSKPKDVRKSVVVALEDSPEFFAESSNFDSAQEVVYHRSILRYITKNSNRWTLRFRDPEREAKFSKWQLEDSILSLRRFLALNIISFAFCVTHDLVFDVSTKTRNDLFAMRFGIILPCFIACFVSVLWDRVAYSPWRRRMIVILELIVVITSVTTSVFMYEVLKDPACKRDDCASTRAWNLYFGAAQRIWIYGFAGMGLLWHQSFGTVLAILVFTYALIIPFGVYSLNPLMLGVVGIATSYVDERTRRTAFYAQFYADELVGHLTAEFVASSASLRETPSASGLHAHATSLLVPETSAVFENILNGVIEKSGKSEKGENSENRAFFGPDGAGVAMDTLKMEASTEILIPISVPV